MEKDGWVISWNGSPGNVSKICVDSTNGENAFFCKNEQCCEMFVWYGTFLVYSLYGFGGMKHREVYIYQRLWWSPRVATQDASLFRTAFKATSLVHTSRGTVE